MKVVHVQTIGEGWGEEWVNGCQRDRKGGNDSKHLNGYGKSVWNIYQFPPLKYPKNKMKISM